MLLTWLFGYFLLKLERLDVFDEHRESLIFQLFVKFRIFFLHCFFHCLSQSFFQLRDYFSESGNFLSWSLYLLKESRILDIDILLFIYSFTFPFSLLDKIWNNFTGQTNSYWYNWTSHLFSGLFYLNTNLLSLIKSIYIEKKIQIFFKLFCFLLFATKKNNKKPKSSIHIHDCTLTIFIKNLYKQSFIKIFYHFCMIE